MAAGYSKTPLVKKLGIKAGDTILPVYCEKDYMQLVGELPEGVQIVNEEFTEPVKFIHLFAKNGNILDTHLPSLKSKLDKNGMLWVSWLKLSSGRATNINGNDVRTRGLDLGLVDIKVCAVDENWSGLKFVYRKEDR